jgi:hypothetical protein
MGDSVRNFGRMGAGALASAALCSLTGAMAAQPAPPPVAQTLPRSTELRRYPAPEASQGVAVDRRHIYAVANSRIAKYDKNTGIKVAEWQGKPHQVPHINSCAVLQRRLICANSNYPQVPMTSSVEILDPGSMKHLRTVALGPGIGSLTWVDRRDGFWWAAFAHYDASGHEAPRDHRSTTLIKFDDQWRRLEGWLFPASVLERFKPSSSSGGGWGDDGLIYVTGHDLPELYALRLPEAGSVLEHVATIPIQVEGQAIAWDRSAPRTLYGISRQKREVVAMRIPPVPAARP